MPEVTKAVALVLLLATLTVVPHRHMLLPGKTILKDRALGTEVAVVEKGDENREVCTLE